MLYFYPSVSNCFNSVKVTELPPVWEKAANSAYHLFFFFFCFCFFFFFVFILFYFIFFLLRYVCPSFLLMFRTSFEFSFGQFLKYLY